MSYPGVDVNPDEVFTKPAGTQEASPGEPKPIEKQSQEVHDAALKEAVGKAVDDMFAVTDAWKPRHIVKFVVNCPSGQSVLVKHLDTMDMIDADLLDEMDFFTRRIFSEQVDDSGNMDTSLMPALKDPEKRQRFFELTGKLMEAASIRPKIIHDGVFIVPFDPEKPEGKKTTRFGHQLTDAQKKDFNVSIPNLQAGQAYSGSIDLGDRMSFFNDLNKPLQVIEPFREEQTVVLQHMAPSEGHGDKTE
jgi:hypothetical protein